MTNPLRSLPKPAPGFWLALLFLVLALVYLAAFVLTAEGQAKQAGAGFRLPSGAQVCTEDNDSRNRRCSPINLAARPFGPQGTNNAPDPAELGRRYAGGPDSYPTTRQPIGLWADAQALNIAALQNWFAEQPEAQRARWSGIPTNEEWYDLAHSQGRRGSAFYATYWFSRLPGGTPEAAIVVTETSYPGHAWRFAAGGGLEKRLGDQQTTNNLGYPVFYRVEWLPGGVEPPPPVPVPSPPPPEPLPPTCEPLAASEFSRLCGLKGQTLEQCERTASRPGATGRLAQAWAKVCREEPPPPPPPAELCPRFRVLVSQEFITLPRYVPGIPSTGRLEIGLELRPEGEGPCE